MTSPERREEASVVSEIYQAAMTSLGIKVLIDALALWADVQVQPNRVARSANRWLQFASSLVARRRDDARFLTMAYYRLVRALHTGFSIPDPEDETAQEAVPLNELRDRFYDAVDEFAPEVLAHEDEEIPGAHADDVQENDDVPDVPEFTEEELIELEEIGALQDEIDRIEEAAEEEARIVLEALGKNNLEAKLRLVDQDGSAEDADAAREEAHSRAGNRQAAAAQRVALNGGRAPLFVMSEKDQRVIGYVRTSRTGTPCGWCAMLISRGLVLYKSSATAERATADAEKRAEGDLYHDNCNCAALPVFSEEQYNEAPQFDLNREYERLWPIVTKGLSGDEALTAWRRYFRQNSEETGQEPAPSRRSAQEAA